MAIETWFYRHDEIMTQRPYGVAVDEDDWLWEGCGHNHLTGHNLRTAACVNIPLPEMQGRSIYHIMIQDGKMVLTLGDGPFYLVYDQRTGRCERKAVPVARPIVWYGAEAPNGKLLLYERSESKVIVLDAPDAEPRLVQCPFEGQLASGRAHSDGLVYSTLSDPARVIRFDPDTERFVDELPLPFPEVGAAGQHEHKGILYFGDSAGGRWLPLDMAKRTWLEPVPTPDYGKVYGFMGGTFSFGGKAYSCLSTYAHRSRLDPKTGKIIIPDGPLTVDGKPPRFLDRYLVFDPEAMSFDYLLAPAQGDGVPLLCYNWTDGRRWAITGMVIPFDEPGEPGRHFGPWLVMQNAPASEEPGFGRYALDFDRKAHIAKYRLGYETYRSLYIPEPTHSPAIVNLRGPSLLYSPGREAELVRRAAKTDVKAYFDELAATITRDAETDADKVKRILGFVRHALYYNPIQEPTSTDPIVILEAHDAKCHQGVILTLKLLEAAGVPGRTVPAFHHVSAEAEYDGSWHLADALFFGTQQPARDGRVVSGDELKAEPYLADAWPIDCFVYDPDELRGEDGFHVQGYVFGIWGSEPYYSYYFGAEMDHPPSLPHGLPAERIDDGRVRLNWTRSLKMGGGRVEYDVRVFRDRACADLLLQAQTSEPSHVMEVPEQNRMYFIEVRAMDDHREKNPDTWYPAARNNFVFVPRDQYGWYGVF